jgi:glycosyltransferase involved in cell wall biosynthesis
MAAGCPCLANAIPTYSDILSNSEYGKITNFKNPKKALKTLVEFLTASSNLLRSVGERGRKRVRDKYDWQIKGEEIFNLYSHVLRIRK